MHSAIADQANTIRHTPIVPGSRLGSGGASVAGSLINKPIGPSASHTHATTRKAITRTRPLQLPSGMLTCAHSGHIAEFVRNSRASTAQGVGFTINIEEHDSAPTNKVRHVYYARLSNLSLIGLSVSALLLLGASVGG